MRISGKAIIVVMWVFLGCNGRAPSSHEDYFYIDAGGLGLSRIPLIKPYEVKKATEQEWRVELQTTQLLELSIHNVKEVNVIDSTILIYAQGDVSIGGISYPEGWFVIIPSRGVEAGFTNRKGFFSFLSKEGIRFLELRKVEDVYNQFNTNGKINWKNLGD